MKASLAREEALIVQESLQRELSLSEAKVNLLKKEIKGFEKKYEISSEEFVSMFEQGKLGDEQDYFEWWGLVKGLQKTEEKVDRIKAVLSR